jgi:quercetin dioxygenase-like cupin family protein
VNRPVYFAAGLFVGILPMARTWASSQDPVAVSPQYYSVRFENDRVRVLEYRLKPGEREETHAHAPGIVYVLSDSTIRTTSPDGTTADRPGRAGEVFWRDATSHSVVNVGPTEAHALAIDVKPCKP